MVSYAMRWVRLYLSIRFTVLMLTTVSIALGTSRRKIFQTSSTAYSAKWREPVTVAKQKWMKLKATYLPSLWNDEP